MGGDGEPSKVTNPTHTPGLITLHIRVLLPYHVACVYLLQHVMKLDRCCKIFCTALSA